MFTIDENKLNPLVSIAVEDQEEDNFIDISAIKEPFIFMSEKGKLISYVHLKSNRLAHKGKVTFQTLLSQSIPI